MCGLFGLAGPGIQKKDLNIFTDLGIISQLRGMEGAGVWQTKSNGSKKTFESWYKTSSSFQEMLDEIMWDKDYKELMNDVRCDVIMGHVRQPTRGKKVTANAHPFVFINEGIVGAHNGTLRDVKYMHEEKTDSELMFSEMCDRGIVPVLRDLEKDSAYAITLYDYNQKALFFARNDRRTLSFAVLKDRNVVYWASEAIMLRMVLARAGEEYEIFNLPVGKVIKMYPSRINNTKESWILHHDFGAEEAKRKADLEARIDAEVERLKKEREEGKEPANPTEKKTGTIIHLGSHPRVSLPGLSIQTGTSNRRASMRSFHRKCNCGSKTLNLKEIYESQAGVYGYPTYDHVNDKFYCDNCLKNMKAEEVKNA